MHKFGYTLIVFALIFSLFLSCDTKNGKSPKDKNQVHWDAITHRTLGLAYLEENKLEEAESEFKELIELTPEEAAGFSNLGLVYLRMGRLDEAESQLDQAVKLNSEDPDIRLLRAKIYELQNQRGKSEDELLTALSIKSDHITSMYQLADLNAGISDPSAIANRKKYLEEIVALVPDNIIPRLELSVVLMKRDDGDGALAQLEVFNAIYPEMPQESNPYFEKAIESLQKGDLDDALNATLILQNFMKVTPMYQSDLIELKGPGGILVGTPILSLSQRASNSLEGTSILDLIRFTDASSAAGLNNYKSDKPGSGNLAIGDFDGDGDQDIYYGDANGKSHLLKNDLGQYADIGVESGITHSGSEQAAIFADIDNNGFLDLFISGESKSILYKNQGGIEFEDVTESAKINDRGAAGVALFLDLDQEGDLDIFLGKNGENNVFQNNSDGTFLETSDNMPFGSENNNTLDAAFGDFDEDGDVDLFLVNENGENALYTNLRQGRFQNITETSGLTSEGSEKTVSTGDFNNDGFLDIFLAGEGKSSIRLFLNQGNGSFQIDSRSEGAWNSLDGFSINDSKFLDFDNDGFLDLVIVGNDSGNGSGARLFHNDGRGIFSDASQLLPPNLKPGIQVHTADYNDDGDLDIFISQQGGGIVLLRNDGGNTNHHLKIQLVGLREGSGKNNRFGIGAKIELRAGDQYQMRTVTGPVVHFGLAQNEAADVVRILWTNGVPQNVFTPLSDQDLVEEQILKGSCPFLYTWNGSQFVFHKDMMWRSALGMPLGIMGGETAYAFPNASKEYLKISGDLMVLKDGKYTLQITEELWETVYFDELKLIALDHPENVDVFVDEGFSPPPFPGMEISQVSERRTPVMATDNTGNNLLQKIKFRDDNYISSINSAAYQGITDSHDLILDLGELENDGPIKLFLNGWIFPSDASINVAVGQSKDLKVTPPYLQVLNENGEWETVIESLGFPMGKDKTIIADLSGKFKSNTHKVRIRTNMQIYWDHIFFTTDNENQPLISTTLLPQSADFHFRGYSASYRKGGRYGPHWFDYSNISSGQKWRDLTGNYTRYGDVNELLLEADNKYIIANAGDEVTVIFDPIELPNLPKGWKRDFLIYSVGWVKDGDLNTAHGQTVTPLPFHEMSQYPYDENKESYPQDTEYQEYMRKYNTRKIDTRRYQRTIIDF